ncbi:MAG: hypothetical protein RL757_1697 [Bacteroidota bacterium]|jgi:hypothetical protein
MSDYQSQQNEGRAARQNASNGRLVLLLGLLGLSGFMCYRAFFGDNTGGGAVALPHAMQVKYVPSDFKPNLDDEKTLLILSDPQRYKDDFDKLIYNFNVSLLLHIATRMDLPEQTRQACIGEYKRQHPYIRQMYFNDFIGLRDSTSQIYNAWYESESKGAVDLLNEVASKYTCFFVTQILTTVLQTQDGKFVVKGKRVETPCSIALTEGLRPTIAKLQKYAAVKDFSYAKGMIKEKVERTIAELAVVEVKDRKGIKKQIDKTIAGYKVSTSTIEISAISVAKIGFDLQKYFNMTVDDDKQIVTLVMPQAQILSHEVYPKVDAVDVGYWAGLTESDFNNNLNTLRQAFREDLNQSKYFADAQTKATELMKTMLEPMIRGINKNYKMQVRFIQPGSLDYNLPNQNPVKTPATPQQQIKKVAK